MTMRPQSADEIQAQLGKVLASRAFANAGRIRRFLEFTVQHAIDAPQETLKEIIIGNELYAENGEFDPRLSSVVRVDATRLRTKLREYYDSEGAADPLLIELPKGSYTPTFRALSSGPREDAPAEYASEPSVAVLPFSNLSPDPGDYFSDGLTEEIIHALSSVLGIRVVARTSCFALKHRNADVREVGRTLHVEFVLEGSVRQSGDALRATVRLVTARDGYQLWSRRYDRRVEDVFAVQDDIAQEIANLLRAGTSNRSPAVQVRPANLEAYSWYLRGRYHLNRQTGESFHRAIDCFEQALLRSPVYPAALSGMAMAWFYLGMFSMERPLEVLPKAQESAARALTMNEREGEALSVSACTKGMFDRDWAAAERLFRKALDAEPQSDLPKHLFALFALLPMARMEEALTMVDEAARVDPLSSFASATRTAVLLMWRRPVEAEAECRRALELDPDFWRALVGLGRCYEAKGCYQEAVECYERANIVSDRVPTAVGALGRAYALAGHRDEALKLVRELDELAHDRYVSPYAKALIYLGLRDERVFECLERSYHDRTGWLMYLASDPRFDPLRSDSRFRSLLERLRLPVINHPPPYAEKASV